MDGPKMVSRCAALLLVLPLTAGMRPAVAADPATIAVLGFSLINTSPAASTPEELDRVRRLGEQLRAALERSGQFRVIDTTGLQAKIDQEGGVMRCNGCELDLARQVGASEVAYGWVQKVSNLILNINLVIEDDNGKKLKAGSVDIRGNTDESWNRGLKFLLEEQGVTAQ